MTATFTVLVDLGHPPDLAEVAAYAARSARFIPEDQIDGDVDAAILARFDGRPVRARRVAAWVETPQDADDAMRVAQFPARLLAIGPDPVLLRALPCACVALPRAEWTGAADDARLVLPFTRSLIRRAGALPETLILDARSWTMNGADVPPSLRPSALAIASVVLVDDADALWSALRWGAAVVCSDALHDDLHLPPEVPRARDDSAFGELAQALAADLEVAGPAARAGHAHFQSVYGRLNAFARTIAWLRLASSRRPGLNELDELNTPAGAVIRDRHADALRLFDLL